MNRFFFVKRSIIRSLPCVLALLAFISLVSHAQDARQLESPRKHIIYFDLPGQPLKQGLIEYAVQSKMNIILERELVEGYRSSPVVGPHYPIEALKLLLSRTSLNYKIIGDSGPILIEPATVEKPSEISEKITATSPNTMVEEVVVSGLQYPFRYNTITNTQMYGNIAVFDTARFINTLPSPLIMDQAPNDLIDLLKYSSGITPADGLADSNDDFYVRGFPRLGVYVDGFRLSTNNGTKQLPANMERVEILKGPSTLFYGQSEPGGIVNIVRKKPLLKSHQRIEVKSGKQGKRDINLDLTGAILPKSNQLSYRLIIADEEQDQFRDLQFTEKQLIAPSLRWAMGTNTSLEISYEQQKNRHIRAQEPLLLVPLGDGNIELISPNTPPSTNGIVHSSFSHQAQPDFSSKFRLFTMELQHYLSSNWSVRSQFFNNKERRSGVRGSRNALLSSEVLVSENELEPETVLIGGVGIVIPIVIGTSVVNTESGDTLKARVRSLYDEQSQEHTRNFKILLDGSGDFAGAYHDISMGLEWYRNTLEERFVLEERRDITSIDVGSNGTDIITAVGGALGNLIPRQQALSYDDYGVFLLNNIELNEQWKLSLGGRYSILKGDLLDINNAQSELEESKEFSSEFGLRYEPVDDIALYLNYSEALKGNYQIDDFSTTFSEPELSTQVELGLKLSQLGGKLTSTMAIFQIDKENIVNIEFIDGLRRASIGEQQRTTGIDVDFTYQISDKIDVIGAFSHIKPEISNGEYQGNIAALAARNTAGIFANYHFGAGWIKGINVNIGMNSVGKRFESNSNRSVIDGYKTLEIGASYKFSHRGHRFRVQVNAKNILDEDYVIASEGEIRKNSETTGKSFIATLGFEY
ncbi:MAG: iron complex outermembrane receptor protein [Lentisphaeria bacterium]|jgi:iron complex outermembrane receptor protein